MNEENKKQIGFSGLKDWLRHRHPMILIDRVIDYNPGDFLISISSISGSLDCINGHFPMRAVYPGSNMIQAFAQSGIILFQLSTEKLKNDEMTLIGSVQTRFFGMVVPGDQIHYHLKVERLMGDTLFFSCNATVNKKRVAAFKGNLIKVKLSTLNTELC